MATLADVTDSLRRHVSYVKRLLRVSPTPALGKSQRDDDTGEEAVEDIQDIKDIEHGVEDAVEETYEDTSKEAGDKDTTPALGKRRRDDGAGDQEADDEDEPSEDADGRAGGDVPRDAAGPGQPSRGKARTAKRAKQADRRSAREVALHKDRHGLNIASLYETDDLPTPLLKLLIKIHSPRSLVAALGLAGDSGAPIAVQNRQAVHFPMTSAITIDRIADIKRRRHHQSPTRGGHGP